MLKTKVAVITGAASGMGRALAVYYEGHGVHVVICDRDLSPAGSPPTLAPVISSADADCVVR